MTKGGAPRRGVGGWGRVQWGFAWRLALREGRHGFRRLGIYMSSITLGVAALVSVHSFRDDVARSVQDEAEELMGANARIESTRPFPDSVRAVLDSLGAAGVETAGITAVASMVHAPTSDQVRLLQVRGVEKGYPFYGAPRTSPEGLWEEALERGELLVDPVILTQLDVVVGDSLAIGGRRYRIAGTVEDLPTDLGFQTALGPRVHLSLEALAEAGILGFGSLARFEHYLRLPDAAERTELAERYEELFTASQVRYRLAEAQARSVSNGARYLGRFLGLVGLGALLLGGIGVASAVHVYVREKRGAIAVLRCLGVGQWTAFTAYLIQAAALGVLGSVAGVTLGVAIQWALPGLVGAAMPVEVTTRLSPVAVLAGLGIGVWVSVVFALIPLLEVRDVPPLQALRQDFEGGRRRGDRVRGTAYGLLAVSVLALCLLEAPEWEVGVGFAGGLALSLAAIGVVGWALARGVARWFPGWAPYPVRQGAANLFRPRNQTLAVTLAVGFGAFVIGFVVEVEGNVRRDLTLSLGSGGPNLLFFDIQPDQLEGVRQAVPVEARAGAAVSPLIPSRIARINGRTPVELRADSTAEGRPEGWALRREYRNTYRESLGASETLVAGRWWDGTPGSEDGTLVDAGGLTRLSLEEDIAEDLRVELGDTITWEISGRTFPSVVTSLRRVDWTRLEPNFFAVFEPGEIGAAPHTLVMVARVEDPERRAVVLRDLVGVYPNVSVLDVSRVQEAIEEILARVRLGVGFLGGFTALAGILVLIGSLTTSRRQRAREGALLRTLGARRGQIVTVLLSEYLALGTVAAASGLLLAAGAASLAVPIVFEIDYRPGWAPLGAIWLGIVAITAAVGVLSSRDLLRRPPLQLLREVSAD